MKKVLILCTGNSCRSIMAEGLINKYFKGKIKAYSAGSNPSGKVNENAKKVLVEEDAWSDEYHSKTVDEVLKYAPFDLVVTVCDNAKESCPTFPGAKKIIHVGFEDPDGKDFSEFVKTANEIKKRLFPVLEKELL
ncbi:arsenate reductase ArsC [Nitrosophilus kaiyonis]|uniref:arsenate reductase ArsC n=1 Tax=Nitrosophilus kaiyonis TaxID=2930200 RepID=UPI0024918CE5|nr:arsenate reductase ArsC [Nitrosophilus kaiyonis]